MRGHHLIRASAAAVLAGGVFALVSVAGPLSPPGGPVASSYKTLTQVEPRTPINSTTAPGSATATYRITQPGSYYLTENLLGDVGKRGIEIASQNVTIDLNGFQVFGGSGTSIAIADSGTFNSIAIRNGLISGWPGGGITLNSRNCLIQDVVVANCAGPYGIRVSFNSVIRNCTVDDPANTFGPNSAAISAACCTVVDGCHVQAGGTGTGIQVTDLGQITNCVVNNCGADGISASNSNVVNNAVGYVAGDGIRVLNRSTIRDNQIVNASQNGIHLTGTDNRVEANQVAGSVTAYRSDGGGNIFLRNAAAGNATSFVLAVNNSGLFVVAPLGGAVNGNSGGTSLGSTDPNANFAY